jgi:RNA polymerase sigma-70 factor (ECF subfamily)
MVIRRTDGADRTDEDLVRDVLRGRQDAFSRLFERYRKGAFRAAYRFVGNGEDALDAVQESFVKAYRALESFEQRSSFRTWLMRIVTNTCLDIRRSRASRHESELSDEMMETTPLERQPHRRSERPLEEAQYDELSLGLQKALEQLSEDHRAVFVLHTQEQMTYREIAESLGINVGTVMSRLFHARKNLQRILAKEGLI